MIPHPGRSFCRKLGRRKTTALSNRLCPSSAAASGPPLRCFNADFGLAILVPQGCLINLRKWGLLVLPRAAARNAKYWSARKIWAKIKKRAKNNEDNITDHESTTNVQ